MNGFRVKFKFEYIIYNFLINVSFIELGLYFVLSFKYTENSWMHLDSRRKDFGQSSRTQMSYDPIGGRGRTIILQPNPGLPHQALPYCQLWFQFKVLEGFYSPNPYTCISFTFSSSLMTHSLISIPCFDLWSLLLCQICNTFHIWVLYHLNCLVIFNGFMFVKHNVPTCDFFAFHDPTASSQMDLPYHQASVLAHLVHAWIFCTQRISNNFFYPNSTLKIIKVQTNRYWYAT